MPAIRNDKERNRIYEQAIRLFMERGYTKTTYKDIAAACDTTKSMVQYYYPKKEMIAERFFQEKLDEFQAKALSIMPPDSSLLDQLTCVGLLHYDFMVNDRQASLFCADLLESRSLTCKVLAEELRWAEDRIQQKPPKGVSLQDQFVVALGGAYDLMFQARYSGENISASTVQLATMRAFWMPMGLSEKEIDDALAAAQKLTGIK